MKNYHLPIKESYLLLKNWWETLELTNYEKSSLNSEIIKFNQQLLRLKEQKLRVGVFGKAGVGKSSILNAIFEDNCFDINILHGTSKDIKSKEYKCDVGLLKIIELIDSPGFDICDRESELNDDIKIMNSDLILFITCLSKMVDLMFLNFLFLSENI